MIQDVSVSEGTGGPVKYGDVNLSSVNIAGFGPSWVYVTGGEIVEGRSFTVMEYAAGARVCVINDKLAETLFPGLDPIGKTIKIFGQPFTVIGLHVEAASLFGGGDEQRLAMPHTTFEKVADYWKGWMDIAVMPVEGVSVEDAQDQVVAAMRGKRGLKPAQENNFAIVTQERVLETFNKRHRRLLPDHARALQRGPDGGRRGRGGHHDDLGDRAHPGNRRPQGARRHPPRGPLPVPGGGRHADPGRRRRRPRSWAGSSPGASTRFTPIPAAVPLWSVVVALLASIVTGIFFGMYPASKASKLDPVEALRYE